MTNRWITLRGARCGLRIAGAVLAAVLTGSLAFTGVPSRGSAVWTPAERETLRSLTLASLPALAPDASNKYGDDPRAAALGRELFFDVRLSGNGAVSCATCHVAGRDFQDGKPLADGVRQTARRTMPIAGTAHGPWFFWDGRSDSQWSQALGPLESPAEHGGTRTQFARVIAAHYRNAYEAVFGAMPRVDDLPERASPAVDSASVAMWRTIPAARQEEISRVYANIGKAIAAFERRIEDAPARFDRYVDAELTGRAHTSADSLSSDEQAGLRLFIGRANCINCHNGPRFTDDHFHNTGVAASRVVAAIDSGRAVGARQAVAGEFSCTSRYSDAGPESCDELTFAVTEGEELVRAYKTPSLRNVAQRAPYMHAGQLATLADVVAHYDRAPKAPFGHSELRPLRLSDAERRQIEAFLRTLSAPLAAPDGWLEPPQAK